MLALLLAARSPHPEHARRRRAAQAPPPRLGRTASQRTAAPLLRPARQTCAEMRAERGCDASSGGSAGRARVLCSLRRDRMCRHAHSCADMHARAHACTHAHTHMHTRTPAPMHMHTTKTLVAQRLRVRHKTSARDSNGSACYPQDRVAIQKGARGDLACPSDARTVLEEERD
eukprot:2159785-Rhodomonas_salina.1